MLEIYTWQTLAAFLSLMFGAASIIVGFDCVWRVEKNLEVFMKLLTLTALIITVRIILNLLRLDSSALWTLIFGIIDFVIIFILFLAFVKIYGIIRKLDREK